MFLHCGAVTAQLERETSCLLICTHTHICTRTHTLVCSCLTRFGYVHPPSEANHLNTAYVITHRHVASVSTNREMPKTQLCYYFKSEHKKPKQKPFSYRKNTWNLSMYFLTCTLALCTYACICMSLWELRCKYEPPPPFPSSRPDPSRADKSQAQRLFPYQRSSSAVWTNLFHTHCQVQRRAHAHTHERHKGRPAACLHKQKCA